MNTIEEAALAALRDRIARAPAGGVVPVTRLEMNLLNRGGTGDMGRTMILDTALETKELPDGRLSDLEHSDGSTAHYYELPPGAKEIQDLISYKNMNAQLGEIFRETYRHGESAHCDRLRGCRKIKFYIEAEIKRLEAEGEVEYEEGII